MSHQGDERYAGGQRRPEGQRTSSGQRRPEGQRVSGGQRRPEGQRVSGGQRRPEGQRTSGGQRRPEGQRVSSGQRRPEGQRTSGGQRRPEGQRVSGGQRRPEGQRVYEGQRRPEGQRVYEGQRRPDRQRTAGSREYADSRARGRNKKKNRGRKKRRNIWIIIIVIVAAIAVAGLFVYHYIDEKMNKIQTVHLDRDKVEKNEIKEETKKVFSGYTTIALFGLDNRSTGNYDTGHSDVIIIMSINNDTEEMQMVSVYRDTYLNTQGDRDRFFKANSAYFDGGPEQAVSMLNVNLDLDIDNYVVFDFETVADAIDALGGVEVELQEDEVKYLNDYIAHTGKVVGKNSKTVSGAGKKTLNGVQAVAYGRIRYTAGNDFKRAERHRIVLTELIKKAKNASMSELNDLMDVVFPEVKTDLSRSDILDMVSFMKDFSLKNSRGFPFKVNCIRLPNSKGGWVDVPCDLESNVIALHEYLYGDENYEPTDQIKKYSDEIISITGVDEDDAYDDEFSEIDTFNQPEGSTSETDSSSDSDSDDN